MASMRIALVQMTSRAAARDLNVDRAAAFVDQAAGGGADIVVLPEFFNNEYFPQYRDSKYMAYAEPDDGYTQTRVKALARAHRLWILSTIFEMAAPGLYYDTAMLIDPEGAIVGKYRKVHPAALLSLEKIYFRGGSSFPTFRIGEWRAGVSTCYDNLFPESCRCLALNGAELILAPVRDADRRSVGELSDDPGTGERRVLAACNHVGQEGEWRMSGKSMIIGPDGKILVQASGTEEQIITATIDRQDVIRARQRFPLFRGPAPRCLRTR